MNPQHQDQENERKAILRLNNQGVSLLEHGDVSTAMMHLSEAFRRSKAAFQEASEAGLARDALMQECDGDAGCCSGAYSLLDHLLTQQRYPDYQPLHARRLHGGEDAAFTSAGSCTYSSPSCCAPAPLLGGGSAAASSSTFVYRQAVYLPELLPSVGPVKASSWSCEMNLSTVSAVLFNLALAHEFVGASSDPNIAPGFSRAVWLRKAAKLYELAFHLQRNERPGKQSLLYLMVVLNNLGQVYRNIGHESGADSCFTQLLSMTMYIINRGETTAKSGSSKEDDPGRDLLEGFIQSTAYLVLKDKYGLPPAA